MLSEASLATALQSVLAKRAQSGAADAAAGDVSATLPPPKTETEPEPEQHRPLTVAELAALERASPELQQLVGTLQQALQSLQQAAASRRGERDSCRAELARERARVQRAAAEMERSRAELERREAQRRDDQLTVERNLGRLLDEKARRPAGGAGAGAGADGVWVQSGGREEGGGVGRGRRRA